MKSKFFFIIFFIVNFCFQGKNCDENVDNHPELLCQNGGTNDAVKCKCPPNFTGDFCEKDVDECATESSICQNGGTCTNTHGGFKCICANDWTGTHCSKNIDDCKYAFCFNGGTCIDGVGNYRCQCTPGKTGLLCHLDDPCLSNPCYYGGTCNTNHINGSFTCSCPQGFEGFDCLAEINECIPNPCKRGAACEDKVGDFECFCPEKWNGKTCEFYDPNYKGNLEKLRKMIENYKKLFFSLEYQRGRCIGKSCPEKRDDKRCDEECNTYACDFDGNDCSYRLKPWQNCTANINCWEAFGNGICDEECNNAQCHFDGYDCNKKLMPCEPKYDSYCKKHYNNGFCDYGCNTEECNWDGSDCENDKEPPKVAEGVISFVVFEDFTTFKNISNALLRDLGLHLRTILRIKKNELGNEMIFPWIGRTITTSLLKIFSIKPYSLVYTEQIEIGVQVYLEIDNRNCAGTDCFTTAKVAAEYLAAEIDKGILPDHFPIYEVRYLESHQLPKGPTNARDAIARLVNEKSHSQNRPFILRKAIYN